MPRIAFVSTAFFVVACSAEQNPAKYSPEQLADYLAAAQTIDAIQPPEELIARVEASVVEDGPGVRRLSDFPEDEMPSRSADVLMKDYIPYYSYYSQKDPSQYIIHPMRTGRFLVENASGLLAPEITEAVIDLAYELPNGGLAWYYPRHYKVARMMGEQLKYSAISQGTLIAGLAAVAAEKPNISMEYARKALLAMDWPFDKGGVNLADRAVLEMPAFAGPPEIILNGWIDALLHIRDFARLAEDESALHLFQSNIDFLVQTLPGFDAPDVNISRYSDVSPYRVKVTLDEAADVDTLRLLYVPTTEGIDPILVPLKHTTDPSDFSIYENQIFRQTDKSALVWLSCSQHYDTVIVADSASMNVEFNLGEMRRELAAPGTGGEPAEKEAHRAGDQVYTVLSPDDGLICGYPTNFAKQTEDGRENFYHVYHVVSLLLLAMGDNVTDDQRTTMIKWALDWLDDMETIRQEERLTFRTPEEMLRAINGGKLVVTYTDWEHLLADAREFEPASQ